MFNIPESGHGEESSAGHAADDYDPRCPLSACLDVLSNTVISSGVEIPEDQRDVYLYTTFRMGTMTP